MVAVLATCAAAAVLPQERHHSLRDGRREVPGPVSSIGSLRTGNVLMLMVAWTLEWYQRSQQNFIGCPNFRSLPHVDPTRTA